MGNPTWMLTLPDENVPMPFLHSIVNLVLCAAIAIRMACDAFCLCLSSVSYADYLPVHDAFAACPGSGAAVLVPSICVMPFPMLLREAMARSRPNCCSRRAHLALALSRGRTRSSLPFFRRRRSGVFPSSSRALMSAPDSTYVKVVESVLFPCAQMRSSSLPSWPR